MCWWNVFGGLPRHPTVAKLRSGCCGIQTQRACCRWCTRCCLQKCAEWCGNDIAHSTDASRHDRDQPCFGGAHTKNDLCWSLELVLDPRCAVLKFSAWTREIVTVRGVWGSQNEEERCQLRWPLKKSCWTKRQRALTLLAVASGETTGTSRKNSTNSKTNMHVWLELHSVQVFTFTKKSKRHCWQSHT